jgi:hypothetical protein
MSGAELPIEDEVSPTTSEQEKSSLIAFLGTLASFTGDLRWV